MSCNSQKHLGDSQRDKEQSQAEGTARETKTAGGTREQYLGLRNRRTVKHQERSQISLCIWKIIKETTKQQEQQGIDPKIRSQPKRP